MKPGAHLEQARNSSADSDAAFGGFRDTAEDFEESGFAAAVAADDADDLALTDFKIDIPKGPDFFKCVALNNGVAVQQVFGFVPHATDAMRQHIAQRDVAAVFGLVADYIFLPEIFGSDNDVVHL